MILLAPMEGLLDFTLRDILTRVGGVDRCVSEFIRVTGSLLPDRVFLRVVPELRHGSRTRAGVPVRAQLMGSDAGCLADNAASLARLGSAGIDLNFGCPAKVVNRHGGGAALLADPALIGRIVAAVRASVPEGIPVSAKMRLGLDDASRAVECAQALVEGGADELVVHARTRRDGYRPPAHWEQIALIRASVRSVPVIANGEIWTVADAVRCRAVSGAEHLMLGRGMVADPGLALAIRAFGHAGSRPSTSTPPPSSAFDTAPMIPWPRLLPLLGEFWLLVSARIEPKARAGRLKQWLHHLRRRYHEAELAYQAVRTVNDPLQVLARLGLDWPPGVPAMPSASPAIAASRECMSA